MASGIEEQLELEFDKFDKKSEDTDNVRQMVINKLVPIIQEMKIEPSSDSAVGIDAKRGLIDTLLKAVNDVDDLGVTRLKLLQKQRDQKIDEESPYRTAQIITEFLKGMNTDISTELVVVEDPSVDNLLDEVASANNITLVAAETSISEPKIMSMEV